MGKVITKSLPCFEQNENLKYISIWNYWEIMWQFHVAYLRSHIFPTILISASLICFYKIHFELERVWEVQPLPKSAFPLSKCLFCWKYSSAPDFAGLSFELSIFMVTLPLWLTEEAVSHWFWHIFEFVGIFLQKLIQAIIFRNAGPWVERKYHLMMFWNLKLQMGHFLGIVEMLLLLRGTILKPSCSTFWFTQKEKCPTLIIVILHHHNDGDENFSKLKKSFSQFSFSCVPVSQRMPSLELPGWNRQALNRVSLSATFTPPPPGIFHCMRIAETRDPNVLGGISGRPSRQQI